jgi:Ca2+-binding EF-hand superfamily protein
MAPIQRSKDERLSEDRRAARQAFEAAMRQANMELDAFDSDLDSALNFREFSRLIREREMGVHTEKALATRFCELDEDGSGVIDLREYLAFALRDAIVRSAANVQELFQSWDRDGNNITRPGRVLRCDPRFRV